MKRFLQILAGSLALAVVAVLPLVLLTTMQRSGMLNTGGISLADSILAGGDASVTPAAVFTITEKPAKWLETVTVLAVVLEKRDRPGGVNVGYWQAGDVILVTGACRQGADVWISFDGGWSAAVFSGSTFVNPSPEAEEVCDE